MSRLTTQTRERNWSRAAIFAVVVFCVFLVTALWAPQALAQNSDAFEQFADASELSQQPISIIIARIIRVFLTVLGIITTVIILYAGYIYLLSAGDPAKIDKAKTMIRNAVIGLFIIFASYAITTFILNALLDSAFGSDATSVSDGYSEPLSSALGSGILDDHYPERDATEIPRNTSLFVTFKKPIEVSTVIDSYDEDETSTALNTSSVLIYKTEEGSTAALRSDEVSVSVTDDQQTFVFDPVEYLGSSEEDTNYTVTLTTGIETDSGDSAFSTSSGYEWTFEVSTEVDLTPPTVTSVVPQQDTEEPRNVTIEVNFSEAMNPVAVTGTFDSEDNLFSNLTVTGDDDGQVNGTFEISNGYSTVGFTTTDACGEDPCGDLIYCLPGGQTIEALVKAATIDEANTPQAQIGSDLYDGAVDAAGNSLDGDDDGTACGSASNDLCEDADDYAWDFTTTSDIEDTVPSITARDPEISEGEISQTGPVTATFNTYLKSSTVDTSSASLWPDPYYSTWFTTSTETDMDEDGVDDGVHSVVLEHPTFVSTADGGWDYWPVFTNDIKSNYQICMFPAIDELSCEDPDDGDRSDSAPWCCAGNPSTEACQSDNQDDAESAGVDAEDYQLPDNSETEDLGS